MKNTKHIKIIYENLDENEDKKLIKIYKKLFLSCLLITSTIFIPLDYSTFKSLDNTQNKTITEKVEKTEKNEHIKNSITTNERN